MPRPGAPAPHTALVVAFLLGAGAIALAMAAGRSEVLDLAFQPPVPVSWLLGAAAGLVACVLLLRSAEQLGRAAGPMELIRAIRIIFLAIAAFGVSAGWLIGSPVPIVAGLVIAGVDVLETTFLLVVMRGRPGEEPSAPNS